MIPFTAETPFQKLIGEFLVILEKNDEREAERFLVDHIKEFPPEVRDGIVMGFLEKTLSMGAVSQEDEEVGKFQTAAIKKYKELENEERSLKKEQGLEEMRASIFRKDPE